MKHLFSLISASLVFAFTMPMQALAANNEAKVPSPAETVFADLEKKLTDKDSGFGEGRLKKLSTAGVKFVCEYPNEGVTHKLIGRMLGMADNMKNNELEMRAVWFARVQADALTKLGDASLPDDIRTALMALDAAMLEGHVRTKRDSATFRAWRERIDELTDRPNSDRFVKDREQGFVDVLTSIKPAAAEAYVRRLIETGGRYTAGWARTELNLIEARKQPFEMKFTGLDGKECDFAKLRGRYVYLFFWGSDVKGLGDQINLIYDADHKFSSRELAIVTVLYDVGIDAARAVAVAKSKRIRWPVYFDGKGEENDFGKKLNVAPRDLPVGYLFNPEGKLIKNLKTKDLVKEVGAQLALDEKIKK